MARASARQPPAPRALRSAPYNRRVGRRAFGRRVIEMRALRITRGRKSWWEADHIVPVVEGGDSNLENIRTLCVLRHPAATSELRERPAATSSPPAPPEYCPPDP